MLGISKIFPNFGNMKRFSAILLLAALWWGGICSAAGNAPRNYLFRQIDSNGGLPDNNVRNMLMLPNGLMCIQTATMLNLYDGAACQSYPFHPICIPYQEYAGLNYLFYDEQHRIWLTGRDRTWRFDLNSRKFEYDSRTLLRPFEIGDVTVESFFRMPDGDAWIVGHDGSLWCCEHDSGKARPVDRPEALRGPLIIVGQGSFIWMLSLDGTLARYDSSLKSFTALYHGGIADSSPLSSRMEMVVASNGDLWMLFDRDLVRYRAATERIENIRSVPLGAEDVYTTIAIDRNDRLWIGSAKSGVTILDAATLTVRNLPFLELTDGRRIDHNTDISKIYVDPHDGVWIATLTEGVFYWHRDIFRLETVNNASLDGVRMPDESVKCLVEEPDGQILLGTIKGLLRYDPRTGRITVPYPELRDELCISLYRDRQERIWLGTFHHGAYCIDRGRIRHYFRENISSVDASYRSATPNPNCVRAFHEDRDGNFWICVYGGLGRFDPESGRIDLLRDRHPELAQFMLTRGVCEVGDKLLVTSDNGCYRYDPLADLVFFDPEDPQGYVPCNQALVDSRGLLWLAAWDGLHVETPDGARYHLSTAEGLPNDNILGLAVDDLGNVWAATFSHLSRIKPIREGERLDFAVASYGGEDGMNAGALFQNALALGADGRLYAGGAHGFCIVDPSSLYQPSYNRTPVISRLRIFDRPVEVGEELNGRCILPRELGQMEHLDLRHDETFLTFEFSNLNYTNPSHTVYRYRLENFDREWTEIHARGTGSATYTLLEPGDYVFRVTAADNDTDWSAAEAAVAFTIHPPFWKSPTAFVLYALAALTTIVLGILYVLRRLRLRAERHRLEEQVRQREEMDQMKFRFFTNISHELRTPLSLILLPLESIIRRTDDTTPFRPQLLTIHRHASQLLSLVNHLLDFRKLEMHGERLNLTRGDMAEFVEGLVDTFGDVAREKELDLTFDNRMTRSYMAFDSAQMYKIVNNLLSNAVKFTPKGGSITVRLSQPEPGWMRLEVSDTGVGIAEEDRKHIFERFYQSARNTQPQGSGIGLCLVKQYAEMHGGRVEVSSETGRGSTFRVEIPMTLRAPNAGDAKPDETAPGEPESHAGESAHCRLLIVEDNADFRAYVAEELSGEFDVRQAEDGEEGLRKAHECHPDIIVCDVMMPRMDGFEVCKRLKNDIETSHIPIILLTARAEDDVRREGYESGADAYLSKPFNMEVLLARIRNLIEERRRRIRSFTSEVDISPAQITVTPLDRQLIDRIMEHVERNIGNPNYSVEELSSDVAMHRMNLYRKLQSITGMTPSEFLRTMRLKRAAQLLAQDDNLSVTEVSEMVGFNTPKYFTRYFREMFGCTPSQYHASRKADDATSE